MNISIFFLNRRFPDRSSLQVFLRGLGRGSLLGLLVLVLSGFVLGLAGGEPAFAQAKKKTELEAKTEQREGRSRSTSAQAKKHYLGGGLAFFGISGETTDETGSDSLGGSGVGIHFSYIYAVNESFWMAGSYAGGVASSDEEDDVDGPDIEYSSLDLHLLYKTSGSFFFGGGLSYISYENESSVSSRNEDEFEVYGFAPNLRAGFFIPLESVSWILDAVWHGEVNRDRDENDRIGDDIFFTSYQISASLLWNF